jgi:hypothetical protein
VCETGRGDRGQNHRQHVRILRFLAAISQQC